MYVIEPLQTQCVPDGITQHRCVIGQQCRDVTLQHRDVTQTLRWEQLSNLGKLPNIWPIPPYVTSNCQISELFCAAL